MKKRFLLILLPCLIFIFSGCSNGANDDYVPEERLTFSVSNKVYSEEFVYDGVKIAQYTYSLPVITPSKEEGNEIAETFNAHMEEYAADLIDRFENEIYPAAERDYDMKKQYDQEWGTGYYTDEVKFTSVSAETYLGIAFDIYTNTGGAHPNTGFKAEMYDLKNGKFFDYTELSDDPEGMTKAISEDLLTQMDEQGLSQNYFDGFESEVESLENAEIYFTEDGLTIVFPDYVLGPHAIGTQTLLVDYAVVDPFLNDYAMTLLYEFTGVVG